MRIKKIHIRNFRAVRDCAVALDPLTALVGPNGAGKSTVLQALLLFKGGILVTAEDFHNKNTAEPIEITVTFGDIPGAAKKEFAHYLHNDEVDIVRVCNWDGFSYGSPPAK